MVKTFTHVKLKQKTNPEKLSFNDIEYAYHVSKMMSSTNVMISGTTELTYS